MTTASDTLAPETTNTTEPPAVPASETAATPGRATGTLSTPPETAAANVPEWARTLPAEDQEWIAKAGHKEVGALVKSGRSLEALLGADKAGRGVVIPANADDADGWNAFYARLGRPAEASGYGLDDLEGADKRFTSSAAAAFHDAGLTQAQADKLTKWHAEFGQGMVDQGETDFQTQSDSDWSALQREWGTAFDRKVELGRRGAVLFGFDAEQMEKIERAIGTRAMMEKFAHVGAGLAEDSLPANDGGSQPERMSAAGAKAEIGRLKGDSEFMAAYLDGRNMGHKAAVDRMSQLHELAARAA